MFSRYKPCKVYKTLSSVGPDIIWVESLKIDADLIKFDSDCSFVVILRGQLNQKDLNLIKPAFSYSNFLPGLKQHRCN